MIAETIQQKTQLDYLREAVKAHVNYMREAKEGRGVDRHLFGLRMLYEEHQGELGRLFILHITIETD